MTRRKAFILERVYAIPETLVSCRINCCREHTHTNTHRAGIVNLVIIYYASTAVQDASQALSFSNVTLTSQDRFYFKVGKLRHREVA